MSPVCESEKFGELKSEYKMPISLRSSSAKVTDDTHNGVLIEFSIPQDLIHEKHHCHPAVPA